MKKSIAILTAAILVSFTGCGSVSDNSATRFLMDTVVNIKADADSETLNGAVEVCQKYENLFSKTITDSDIYKLNHATGDIKVDKETVLLLKKSMEFAELSGGLFDITVCSATDLWDFEEGIIPNSAALHSAVEKIGYKNIVINGNTVNTGNSQIDLGGIAKGYIADKVKEYFVSKGVKTATVNLGGNVLIMGDDYSTVGIRNPFSDDIQIKLLLKNTSAVTSGTYERCFEKDGIKYHHILNPKTGYPIDSDLVSVTVINESSTDADALSTTCLLFGFCDALKLIENRADTEAVFITVDGQVHFSSGIYCEDGYYRI